jgi:hypothetical protein
MIAAQARSYALSSAARLLRKNGRTHRDRQG